jgi:hypothetical protein
VLSSRRHASYLFAASEVVRTFGGAGGGGHDPNVQAELQPMLNQMFMEATGILRR